jgi:ADP-ribose pyrophosphatase
VDVVEHSGAVAIVPIDDEDRVWLVRQYRHPVGKRLLEIPAGTLSSGEPPENCAQRESREEIGMLPGELLYLGSGYMAPGYSTEEIHFYLARKLEPDPLPRDKNEDISLECIHWPRLWEKIERGQIRDVKTIAGLCLAREWLQRNRTQQSL